MVEALLDQLLQPERFTAILTALKARRDDKQASADRRLVDLARQAGVSIILEAAYDCDYL